MQAKEERKIEDLSNENDHKLIALKADYEKKIAEIKTDHEKAMQDQVSTYCSTNMHVLLVSQINQFKTLPVTYVKLTGIRVFVCFFIFLYSQ